MDISDTVVSSGTKIAYNRVGHFVDVNDCSYIQSPEFDSWILVIDNDPSISGRNYWTHIFVDVKSGEYSVVEIEGRAVIKWDTSRNICIPSDRTSGAVIDNMQRIPERVGGTTRWAVIISGGCDSLNNKSRFYNDCVNVYTKLTQDLGYPKGNIFCLISDGTDPALDQRTSANTYVSSDPDLDGDLTIDVQYNASRTSISTVFDNLSELVSSGDEVLVFMTDHGSPYGLFYLWNYETLSPYQLNTELNKLGSSVMIDVVMGQCYSGAFVGPLSASNRTISTSCLSTENAWVTVYGYNFFLHYWTEAIPPSCVNDDSYVSPYELYLSSTVSIMHLVSQHPQYSSTPNNFGDTHSIKGELIPYIIGSNYLSTTRNTQYNIVNYPNPSSITWLVGHSVSIVSHTDSTAIVKGNITSPGHFFESPTTVTAQFEIDNITHKLTKNIESVWKPGTFINGNNIWGSNGNYQVKHTGGEYGYMWGVDNSAWQIIGSNDSSVSIIEGYTNNPVNLIVSFFDPMGDVIIVQDRVH